MIILEEVSFHYQQPSPQPLFQGLSLALGGSAVVLGPSGVGKSTLLRLVAGYLQPQSGRVEVDRFCPSAQELAARRRIAYVPQDNSVPGDLTLWEYLFDLARIDLATAPRFRPRVPRASTLPDDTPARRVSARERVRRVVERVHLEFVIDRRLKWFSGGMKRRVMLAAALLRDSQVLLVDEPTAGLDPDEQAQMLTLLQHFAQTRQIVMATQVVQDALALPDCLVVLQRDRSALQVDADTLIRQARGHVFAVEGQAARQIASAAAPAPAAPAAPAQITGLWMPIPGNARQRVLAAAAQPGWTPLDPTIEDGYLWSLRAVAQEVSQ